MINLRQFLAAVLFLAIGLIVGFAASRYFSSNEKSLSLLPEAEKELRIREVEEYLIDNQQEIDFEADTITNQDRFTDFIKKEAADAMINRFIDKTKGLPLLWKKNQIQWRINAAKLQEVLDQKSAGEVEYVKPKVESILVELALKPSPEKPNKLVATLIISGMAFDAQGTRKQILGYSKPEIHLQNGQRLKKDYILEYVDPCNNPRCK